MTWLSLSTAHQFSIDRRKMCSTPLSSTVYCRIAPLTMNAAYLHTSPSCNRYCFFLIFLCTKVFSINSTSLLVRGVFVKLLMYLISGSCIDFVMHYKYHVLVRGSIGYLNLVGCCFKVTYNKVFLRLL